MRGRGCARCLQKRPSHELRTLALESAGFVHLQENGVAQTLRGETTFAEPLENTPA